MAEDIVVSETDTSENEVVSRVYEVGYLVMSTVADDQVEKVVGDIRSVIEKAGGSFIAEGAPVLTKLSYGMDAREGDRHVTHDKAYFGWIKFEAPTAAVQMLSDALKAHASVLRNIVFQTVREETRARIKAPTLREVKRTDTIRSSPKRPDEESAPVSEADLEKALQDITAE